MFLWCFGFCGLCLPDKNEGIHLRWEHPVVRLHLLSETGLIQFYVDFTS